MHKMLVCFEYYARILALKLGDNPMWYGTLSKQTDSVKKNLLITNAKVKVNLGRNMSGDKEVFINKGSGGGGDRAPPP